jgi:hypothetical protein
MSVKKSLSPTPTPEEILKRNLVQILCKDSCNIKLFLRILIKKMLDLIWAKINPRKCLKLFDKRKV